MQDSEVLAIVRASAPRRWLAVSLMASLGLLLLWVAISTPPTLGWQIFLIAMGAGSLWLADRLRRATANWLELTRDGLRDNTGQIVIAMDQIRQVERGMFAFKPSNGFLIHGSEPMAKAWEPGLWWRFGKRVAIGGVTAASQTKFMSEIIAAQLFERDGAGRDA